MLKESIGNSWKYQDWAGKLQVYVKFNTLGEEKYEIFCLLDLGAIIGVEGGLVKTRTGEITIITDDITVLSKALFRPPGNCTDWKI